MLYTQALGQVSDEVAYKTWNMGQGMVVITPNPKEVLKTAQSHGIEARVIGFVTEDEGIRIRNMGVCSPESNHDLKFDSGPRYLNF